MNAGDFRPLGYRQTMTIKLYKFIPSSIVLLFFLGGPLAIAGFIISVVVYALYAVMFARSIAHVGKKVFKLMPAIANLNATLAIVFKKFVVRVGASLNHVIPRPICQRIAKAMSCCYFFMKTAARLCNAFYQAVKINILSFPAITFTSKIIVGKLVNYGKSSKFFTDDVLTYFRHSFSFWMKSFKARLISSDTEIPVLFDMRLSSTM